MAALLTKSWIAADDLAVEGTFRISAGPEVGSPMVYTSWMNNQPDNSNGNEDCISFWPSSESNNWNDVPCLSARPFVIEYGCTTGRALTPSGCVGMIKYSVHACSSCE